jgi:hypothetical protein
VQILHWASQTGEEFLKALRLQIHAAQQVLERASTKIAGIQLTYFASKVSRLICAPASFVGRHLWVRT